MDTTTLVTNLETAVQALVSYVQSAIVAPATGRSSPSASQIAEGFTVTEFFDDFNSLSTIYPTLPALNTPPPSTVAADGTPVQWFLGWQNTLADFAVSNSILTINRDGSGYGQALQSMDGAHPQVGYTYGGSASLEVMCWSVPNGTPQGFPNSMFVFWSESQNLQIENVNEANGNPVSDAYYVEVDVIETPTDPSAGPDGGGVGTPIGFWYLMDTNSFHRYPAPGQSPPYNQDDVYLPWAQARMNADIINLVDPNFDPRKPHAYRCDFHDPADNGGVGLIKRFVDGVHLPSGDVTWQPGDGNRLNYATGDRRYLLLGTGSVPSYYDYVKVCKKP